MRYRLISKGGRYTVRVSHDFGWKADAKRKYPVAEGTVVFREPDAKQAEQVLAGIVKLPENQCGNDVLIRAVVSPNHRRASAAPPSPELLEITMANR